MIFLYLTLQIGIQNKILRFLGYKATGYLNSWIRIKIMILENL